MKKLFLASVVFGAFVTSAIAADKRVKARILKAPPPAPVYNWTGCYIGGSAGGIWGQSSSIDVTFVDGGATGAVAAAAAGAIPLHFNDNASSWLAGGQLGCNYKVAPNWVVGLETDISGTQLDGGQTINTAVAGFFPLTSTGSDSMTWIGTTRGRLGWAHDNVLVYATGGGAYANVNHTYVQNNVAGGGSVAIAATDSATESGWTAGGGIEVGFGAWSVKGEYLYYDLGSHTLNAPNPRAPATVFSAQYKDTGSIARVGLNYHFNLSGPVAAKY
jgi:outer membrane immunogenic protein